MSIIPYKSVLGAPLLRYPLILVSVPVPRKQRLVTLILNISTVDKDHKLKIPKVWRFLCLLKSREHTLSFWNFLILTNKTRY